jgi:hypothetical protein
VPALRARLRAATRELDELAARLRSSRGAALRDDEALDRQEGLRATVERAGWCLGAVGSLLGTDLLGARRERAGLRWLAAAVAEASGRTLEPPADELPLLARSDEHALRVALLAAWAVLHVPGEGALHWRTRVEHEGVWLELDRGEPPPREREEFAARCAELGSAQGSRPGLRPAGEHVAVGPL